MEVLCENITKYFLQRGLIQTSQIPWCKYMIKHRAMDMISLLWLVPVGSLVSSWYISGAFVLSYRFLRARTGGYHAKTPLGCIFASTVTQFIGVSLAPYIKGRLLFSCLLIVSSLLIVILSPANNAEIHLTQEEMQALLPRIKIRLLFLWLMILVFSFIVPEMAASILLGVFETALLLFFSRIGIGVS